MILVKPNFPLFSCISNVFCVVLNASYNIHLLHDCGGNMNIYSPEKNHISRWHRPREIGFFLGGGEILTIRPLIEKILARREKKIDFTDFYFLFFFLPKSVYRLRSCRNQQDCNLFGISYLVNIQCSLKLMSLIINCINFYLKALCNFSLLKR